MKLSSSKILAIDYDGVIHDYLRPVAGRRMGPPMEGAKIAMEGLSRLGFQLIIHTVRGSHQQHIMDWCNYYQIPYDDITDIKPNADFYIDDRAIRFHSWSQTIEDIEGVIYA